MARQLDFNRCELQDATEHEMKLAYWINEPISTEEAGKGETEVEAKKMAFRTTVEEQVFTKMCHKLGCCG